MKLAYHASLSRRRSPVRIRSSPPLDLIPYLWYYFLSMSEFAPVDNIAVVKVGTSVLSETLSDGRQVLDPESFRRIGSSILELESVGVRVVLVTSGAITAGMASKGLTERPDKTTSLPELQWLSSVGWPLLLKEWATALDGRTTGGILLTKSNLDLASPRKEALQTLHTGLVQNDTPIINENDAITHTEIAYGDNDVLTGILAAQMVGHSALFGSNIRVVILSDVHGVYENRDDPSTRIHIINHIRNYERLAGGVGSANATGGMASKFDAARIVTEAGMHMYIAHGKTDGVIQNVLSGKSRTTGTEFLPKVKK